MNWNKLMHLLSFDKPIEYFKQMMVYLYAKPKERDAEPPQVFWTDHGEVMMPEIKPFEVYIEKQKKAKAILNKIAVAVTKKVAKEIDKKQQRTDVLEEGMKLLKKLNEENIRYSRRIEREHAKIYPAWWIMTKKKRREQEKNEKSN